MRTGSFRPALSTMNTSKFSKPSLFDANRKYSPDGCSYGAQLIEPKSVICFLSVPSGFIVHTLAISPFSSKWRHTMRPSLVKNVPPS